MKKTITLKRKPRKTITLTKKKPVLNLKKRPSVPYKKARYTA